MIILSLATTEINKDVEKLSQQWNNIVEKPITKEVQAFIDELNANTDCCQSTTKTFTRNPLTGEEFSNPTKKEKGHSSSHDAQIPQGEKQPITIFMSYSVPKAVWQGLWKEAETLKQPIQFVLRGLPNNSFQELAKKVMEYGCPVLIDPPLFEHHNITAVPAFLTRKKRRKETHQHSDDRQDHDAILYGNVSLACAIDHSHVQNSTEKHEEIQS